MLALLCSGQGHQHSDMFRLTAEAGAAAGVFAAAGSALGRDPRVLAREAEPAVLHENRTAQVCCVAQALAAAAALEDVLGRRRVTAGYSIGELAAWGVAGALSPETVPALAVRRAELMDAAGQEGDGLAFSHGLSEAEVRRLASETGVEPAIFNPGQVILVGGPREALVRFMAAAREAGARRTDLLDVPVASHTSRLASAVDPFLAALTAAGARRPSAGRILVSALDGSALSDPPAQIATLARQVATPLRWDACLEAVFEHGATAVLEFGPGRALAEMASAVRPDIPARSLEDFRTLDGVHAWLSRLGAGR